MAILPPEISFGFVVGRWILAVGDTEADPDELPDAAVPTGTVTFTRIDENVNLLDTTQNDGTWVAVARKSVMAVLNDQGELALEHSTNAGLWLITGAYTVAVSVSGLSWTPFTIIITTDHTPENPLDLVTASPVPITPTTVLVPSIDTMVRAEAAADRAEQYAQQAKVGSLPLPAVPSTTTHPYGTNADQAPASAVSGDFYEYPYADPLRYVLVEVRAVDEAGVLNLVLYDSDPLTGRPSNMLVPVQGLPLASVGWKAIEVNVKPTGAGLWIFGYGENITTGRVRGVDNNGVPQWQGPLRKAGIMSNLAPHQLNSAAVGQSYPSVAIGLHEHYWHPVFGFGW